MTRLAEWKRRTCRCCPAFQVVLSALEWRGSDHSIICGRKRAGAEAMSCWWASSCKVIRALIGCLFAWDRGGQPPKRIYFGRLTSSPSLSPVSPLLQPAPPAQSQRATRSPLSAAGRARRLGLPNLTAVGNASFHSALHEGMPGFDRSARFLAPRLPLLPARRDGGPRALNLPRAQAHAPQTTPLRGPHRDHTTHRTRCCRSLHTHTTHTTCRWLPLHAGHGPGGCSLCGAHRLGWASQIASSIKRIASRGRLSGPGGLLVLNHHFTPSQVGIVVDVDPTLCSYCTA